jgi:hypothetical protein
MKNLMLALAAAGAIGLTGFATPAAARIASGVVAPAVESNTVQARCHHHRWSSRWHCYRRHHHYWLAQPFYYQPYHFHYHHRWHRRHRHHWYW